MTNQTSIIYNLAVMLLYINLQRLHVYQICLGV